MNKEILLTPFDPFSQSFQSIASGIPAGCSYRFPNRDYTQMQMVSRDHSLTYTVTLLRRGLNSFSGHCTCLAGQRHRLCWHKAEAWRVASLMNGWPEREIPLWLERHHGAVQMGLEYVTKCFANRLERIGYQFPKEIAVAQAA